MARKRKSHRKKGRRHRGRGSRINKIKGYLDRALRTPLARAALDYLVRRRNA